MRMEFSITGRTKEALTAAFDTALLSDHEEHPFAVTGWRVETFGREDQAEKQNDRLVLMGQSHVVDQPYTVQPIVSESERWPNHPFLSPVESSDALSDIVWEWLQRASRGRRPNIDGSTTEGFKVWGNDMGGVAVICVVEPIWIEYHK